MTGFLWDSTSSSTVARARLARDMPLRLQLTSVLAQVQRLGRALSGSYPQVSKRGWLWSAAIPSSSYHKGKVTFRICFLSLMPFYTDFNGSAAINPGQLVTRVPSLCLFASKLCSSRACVLFLWLYLFYNILSLSMEVALCLSPVTCHQVLVGYACGLSACGLSACGLPIAQCHMSFMASARLSE